MKWDDGLKGPAKAIASTSATPLCVVAGPGTGKTFALMRRLARLLEVEKVSPETILACTFTRTAAEDLTRAVSELGISGTERVATQTVHGFCFSMLTREAVLVSTGRTPRPLLPFEERFLLEDLCHHGVGGIQNCRKKLQAFAAAWARLQHEEAGWPKSKDDKRFQAVLTAWLKFHEAMLIGELISEAVRYLRNNPASPYRTVFDHVLVDEYQDLNRAEQVLVELIAAKNLVIIGDEDQSIYSFKHAHPEGITEFPDCHEGTEEASLDECRRCPKLVVELANHLISQNASRSGRELTALPSNPNGDIFVVQWSAPKKEAEGLAAFLAPKIESGAVAAGEVLILAPRRELGFQLRDALAEKGVPAHCFYSEQALKGDPKNLDGSRARQVMALLGLLANPDDRVSLRVWCGFGSANLASVGWARLRAHCEKTGESPRAALRRLLDGDLEIAYTGYLCDRFALLLAQEATLDGVSGADLGAALFPDGETWAAPLADIAARVEEDDFDAKQLLDVLRRNIAQPEMPTDVDYVRIMTPHKSKGLTADLVIVSGCVEGLQPAFEEGLSSSDETRSLEEQRRVFYVAITRTRQSLVLSSVMTIPLSDAHRMRVKFKKQSGSNAHTIASQFLSDLGPKCPAAVTGPAFLASQTGSTQ